MSCFSVFSLSARSATTPDSHCREAGREEQQTLRFRHGECEITCEAQPGAADRGFGTRERIDRKQVAAIPITAEDNAVGPHAQSAQEIRCGDRPDRRGIDRVYDAQSAIRRTHPAVCRGKVQRAVGCKGDRIEEVAGITEQHRDPSHSVDDVKIARAGAPVVRTTDAKQGIGSGLVGEIGDVDRSAIGGDRNACDDRAGGRIEAEQVTGSAWSGRWRKTARRLCRREQRACCIKRQPRDACDTGRMADNRDRGRVLVDIASAPSLADGSGPAEMLWPPMPPNRILSAIAPDVLASSTAPARAVNSLLVIGSPSSLNTVALKF